MKVVGIDHQKPGDSDAVSLLIGGAALSIGNPLPTNAVVAPVIITTPTSANVAGAVADTQLLAANAARKPGSIIVNDSTSILYVKLGTGASPTSYTAAIDGKTTVGGVFYVPDGYTGIVNGYWVSATGSARVTEMT